MSELMKGMVPYPHANHKFDRTPIIVEDSNGRTVEFPTVSKAAEALGVSVAAVSHAVARKGRCTGFNVYKKG